MNEGGRPDIVTNTGVLLNEGAGAFHFREYSGKGLVLNLGK